MILGYWARGLEIHAKLLFFKAMGLYISLPPIKSEIQKGKERVNDDRCLKNSFEFT